MTAAKGRRWFERRTEPPVVRVFEPPRELDAREAAAPQRDPGSDELHAELERARAELAALSARFGSVDAERDALRDALRAAQTEEEALRAEANRRVTEALAEGASAIGAIESRLLDLAIAVARRVVGRELTTDRDLLVAWAREALAEAGLGLARLAASTDAAPVFASAWTETPIDFDPSLPADTCELRSETQVVEISADARLETVVEQASSKVRAA